MVGTSIPFRRAFRVGTAFSETFTVLGRAWSKLLLLAAIPLVPLWAIQLIAAPYRLSVASTFALSGTDQLEVLRQMALESRTMGLAFTFLPIFLALLANAMCLYGAYQTMRGKDFTIGESISRALSRLLSILGVVILVEILIVLGTILLVVPGIIAMLMFFLAVPACVAEMRSPIASLKRSRDLTKGARWKLLGFLVLIGVASLVFQALLTFIGAKIGGLYGAGLLGVFAQLVFTALYAVATMVAYRDLRVEKEGADADSLSNVFA